MKYNQSDSEQKKDSHFYFLYTQGPAVVFLAISDVLMTVLGKFA